MTQSSLQYKVLITPLIAKNIYGDEIDVTADIDISELVSEKGIGKIKSEIDNGDYEFGIFTFSDISLDLINYDGRFNDEFSSRSIFKFKRDKAKVKIRFISTDGNSDINFEGIINDEATRQDNNKGIVKFKVLSNSSIFKKTKVPAGVVTNGVSFSTAIKVILNNVDIQAVLNFDENDLNLGIDLVVDDGSKFDNKVVQTALNELLLVSSSVLFVNEDSNIIITTRINNNNINLFNFYAGNDVFGRENVISIKKFNNGLHRLFNSIVINGVITEDPISISNNGIRQKALNFDFITNSSNFIVIANAILDDFKNLRSELELKVRAEDSINVKLLDNVVVDLTTVLKPAEDKKFFPLYGVSKYADDNYPLVINPLPILKNQIFKVIGTFEDPKGFTKTLKLRASGQFLIYENEELPVYGQAIYGQNKYQSIQ